MRYRYLDDFRRGISVFALFSYGIAVLGTPQCPPQNKITQKMVEVRLSSRHTLKSSSRRLPKFITQTQPFVFSDHQHNKKQDTMEPTIQRRGCGTD